MAQMTLLLIEKRPCENEVFAKARQIEDISRFKVFFSYMFSEVCPSLSFFVTLEDPLAASTVWIREVQAVQASPCRMVSSYKLLVVLLVRKLSRDQ